MNEGASHHFSQPRLFTLKHIAARIKLAAYYKIYQALLIVHMQHVTLTYCALKTCIIMEWHNGMVYVLLGDVNLVKTQSFIC